MGEKSIKTTENFLVSIAVGLWPLKLAEIPNSLAGVDNECWSIKGNLDKASRISLFILNVHESLKLYAMFLEKVSSERRICHGNYKGLEHHLSLNHAILFP